MSLTSIAPGLGGSHSISSSDLDCGERGPHIAQSYLYRQDSTWSMILRVHMPTQPDTPGLSALLNQDWDLSGFNSLSPFCCAPSCWASILSFSYASSATLALLRAASKRAARSSSLVPPPIADRELQDWEVHDAHFDGGQAMLAVCRKGRSEGGGTAGGRERESGRILGGISAKGGESDLPGGKTEGRDFTR